MSHQLLVIFGSVLNFALLIALLMKFVKPKLVEAIQQKRDNTIKTIDQTEQRLAEVSSQLEEQRQRLEAVEGDIRQIRTHSQEVGRKTAEAMRETTQQEARQMRERVEKQIAQELNQLKTQLRQEFTQNVVRSAERMAADQLTKSSHAALIESIANMLKKESSRA